MSQTRAHEKVSLLEVRLRLVQGDAMCFAARNRRVERLNSRASVSFSGLGTWCTDVVTTSLRVATEEDLPAWVRQCHQQIDVNHMLRALRRNVRAVPKET